MPAQRRTAGAESTQSAACFEVGTAGWHEEPNQAEGLQLSRLRPPLRGGNRPWACSGRHRRVGRDPEGTPKGLTYLSFTVVPGLALPCLVVTYRPVPALR